MSSLAVDLFGIPVNAGRIGVGAKPEVFDFIHALKKCYVSIVAFQRSIFNLYIGLHRAMGGKITVAERTQLASQGGARYRVRTCDPYRVKVVLYH